MPTIATRCTLLWLTAAVAVSLAAPARAEYPERTVKIVVPFEAGGTVDTVARALADRLRTRWQVAVIVENRPGAGNIVGAQAVAKAEPDGYTLLLANTSISVNPSLYKTLPYDTRRDLAPLVFLAPSPNVLLVQKSLGVATLKDLIALARSRAGQPLTFASVGKGSFHHFSMELFKTAAGVELVHVPYKGVAPAMLAFIAQSYPKANLVPQDAFAFAQVQSINSYLCSTVHVAHAHKGRGYRWATQESSFADMKGMVPKSMAMSRQ